MICRYDYVEWARIPVKNCCTQSRSRNRNRSNPMRNPTPPLSFYLSVSYIVFPDCETENDGLEEDSLC